VITKINFSNYKRIGEQGILMYDTVGVNYLVGANNSGKTSVLNYIFETFEKPFFITDSATELDIISVLDTSIYSNLPKFVFWPQVFNDLLEKSIFVLDLFGLHDLRVENGGKRLMDVEKVVFEQAHAIIEKTQSFEVEQNWHPGRLTMVDSESLTSGQNKLWNLVYAVVYGVLIKGKDTFLIDNPANKLPPALQKKLPILLDLLAKTYSAQFFVATHSPFLISAVGELTECSVDQEEHCLPTQKVYFLKDGQVASRSGKLSHKGSNGYSGRKVAQMASSMLGAGLIDLYSPQIAIETNNAPSLILCEGEGNKEDASIYNIIFRDRKPRVLFISSRGSNQLYKSYQLLQEIKPGLSSDFHITMVRDRDHEFLSEKDIQEYETTNPGVKILKRRAIEMYLYSVETASLVLARFNRTILKKDQENMEYLQKKIMNETMTGVKGNAYKEEIYDAFIIAVRGYGYELFKGEEIEMAEKVARLITPQTETYKELASVIF
jgi:hypothetical protein